MSGSNLIERIVEEADNMIHFISSNLRYFVILILIFGIGFSVGVFASLNQETPQKQLAIGEEAKTGILSYVPYSSISPEKPSPMERITEDQIHVFKDRVTIDLKDAEWATFTDTNSMDPIFDYGSYAIEVVPTSEENITVGDIISYKSQYASGTIIHRIVEIGKDDNGWFCKAKGDNNKDVDPGKIRFSQIQRVLVAIIY